MERNNILKYKDYYAKIEYSTEDSLLWGKIEGINDLVLFESEDPKQIEHEFIQAVDEYLSFCEANHLSPEKPYKGSFNVRISPDLHKSLALYSFQNDISLNASVEKAIRELLAPNTNRDFSTKWIATRSGSSPTASNIPAFATSQSNLSYVRINQ